MPTAAQRFADFAVSLPFQEIPAEVVEAAKLHLVDTVGCALAAHAVAIAGEGRAMMEAQGGRPDATVIGLGEKLPAASAAFANAMLAHGLDYDDTHSDSMTHVSAAVGPACLAMAEARGATGRELVAAIVAGSEIVTRIGMVRTGAFHARGFHATEVCGVLGATAGACRLDGASAATAASAVGIAGSFAGGLFAYLDEGTATKPIHPAWAAHGAVIAADLAGRGAEGPTAVLEGRYGVYHAFIDAEPGSLDLEAQLSDLGRRWETPRIAYKPYPVCHFIHGSLGATASLLDGLRAEDVEEIEVSVPEPAVPIVLEPAEMKTTPRTDYDGKFSLQYSTAAMIATGKVDVRTFGENALRDEAVLNLARKVTYVVRDYDSWPAAFPGGVRITTRNGSVLEADQPHQLGAPENPMSPAQVLGKFRDNASLALDSTSVDRLEAGLLGLEDQRDIGDALAPLRGMRVAGEPTA